MWKSEYVGVYQLLNWKMHGETLKFVKKHRYKFCIVVATCVSGCGVCTGCRTAHAVRHPVHTPQPGTHVATTMQNV